MLPSITQSNLFVVLLFHETHGTSVAEISRRSVLSEDRIRQCVTSSGSRRKDRSVSVSRHFLRQAPQCSCFVRKLFSRDHLFVVLLFHETHDAKVESNDF